MGLNPSDASDASDDSDDDGIPNLWEYEMGLDASDASDANEDADNDGIPNLWEYQMGLNATNLADAEEDSDNDGLTNLEEYNLGLSAIDDDSDDDGMSDGWEYQMGLNEILWDGKDNIGNSLSPGAYIYRLKVNGKIQGKKLMLGKLIQLQFASSRNWPFGSAIALILMSVVLIAMMIYALGPARKTNMH